MWTSADDKLTGIQLKFSNGSETPLYKAPPNPVEGNENKGLFANYTKAKIVTNTIKISPKGEISTIAMKVYSDHNQKISLHGIKIMNT